MNLLNCNKEIVLTPFCAESVLLFHKFKLDGIEVDAFFDRNPLMEDQNYCGVYIQRAYYRTNTIVIVCSDQFCAEIEKHMRGYGFEDVLMYDDIETSSNSYEASSYVDIDKFVELMPAQRKMYTDFSDYIKLKKYKRLRELGAPDNGITYEEFKGDGLDRTDNYADENGIKHILIKRIELDVTTCCSLRCGKCGNLMQYFEHPTNTPKEQIISDYNRMMELVEWTDDVLIMGGEPFCHKELDAVIKAVLEHPMTKEKVGSVNIVTNGTIVPDKKVIDVLRGSEVTIWISNYRDKSKRIKELIRICQQNSIKYDIMNVVHWANVQQLIKREKQLNEDALMKRRLTCGKKHHAVSEGKFFLCAFTNGSYKLHAVPDDERNYVDIYANDAVERIYEYLSPKNPMPPACSWCNGNFDEAWKPENQIPAAEQIDKPIPYKHYD